MLNSHRWNKGYPERVLILRALMLGDMLCCVPALRAVRRHWPQSHITLVGLPWARNFAARFHDYVDDFVDFPGFPGLPERSVDVERFAPFLQDIQQQRFDLALQMHGSGSFVNPLLALFGAKVNAGFYEGHWCPDADHFMPFPKQTHEIHIFLKFLFFLGIPQEGDYLEFPLSDQDRLDFLRLGLDLSPQRYVCIHPGARLPTRRWPAGYFAQVADRLSQAGLRIVITGGPDEVDLAAEVSRLMSKDHINSAGRTSLGALAVLLEQAALLVSNDTGVSHIAAALRVPSVVVITGSDPKRWAPLDAGLHQAAAFPVDCRPCVFSQCPFGLKCGLGITPETVVGLAEHYLKAGVAHVYSHDQ